MKTPAHVGVIERVSGDTWRAPLSWWLKIQKPVMNCEEWVEFVTLDGARVHLRCADISSLTYVDEHTAEAIDERRTQEMLQ